MEQELLVVDDDEPIRQLLIHRLEGAGFDVRTCQDGQEAAEMLDRADYEPDAVLLDVMMPRLDGTRLAQMIREGDLDVRPDLPVVMLTSRAREEDVVDGFDAGVDDYVTKPFQSAELLARIQQQLPTSTT